MMGWFRLSYAPLALLFLIHLLNANASIHHYSDEPFTHRSNAFFFHGGSEALFSSSSHNHSSFIRYPTPF